MSALLRDRINVAHASHYHSLIETIIQMIFTHSCRYHEHVFELFPKRQSSCQATILLDYILRNLNFGPHELSNQLIQIDSRNNLLQYYFSNYFGLHRCARNQTSRGFYKKQNNHFLVQPSPWSEKLLINSCISIAIIFGRAYKSITILITFWTRPS